MLADKAREIATRFLVDLGVWIAQSKGMEHNIGKLTAVLLVQALDARIETLEAWRTEHRSIRTHWMEYGKSDECHECVCHECVAIERQLTRLRREREKLNAASTITE